MTSKIDLPRPFLMLVTSGSSTFCIDKLACSSQLPLWWMLSRLSKRSFQSWVCITYALISHHSAGSGLILSDCNVTTAETLWSRLPQPCKDSEAMETIGLISYSCETCLQFVNRDDLQHNKFLSWSWCEPRCVFLSLMTSIGSVDILSRL